MIRTLEEFLKAFNEKSSGRLAAESDGHEFHYDFYLESLINDLEPGLMRQLERLGILYTFGGVLEINPMAIRILMRLRTEGKDLSAENFRREVEASKDLYHSNHLNGELEDAFF
jgi:hypothetical protein